MLRFVMEGEQAPPEWVFSTMVDGGGDFVVRIAGCAALFIAHETGELVVTSWGEALGIWCNGIKREETKQ